MKGVVNTVSEVSIVVIFYDFSIRFGNCSDGVVFCVFRQQTKTWLNIKVCIYLLVIKLCGLTHGKDTHRMFKREM